MDKGEFDILVGWLRAIRKTLDWIAFLLGLIAIAAVLWVYDKYKGAPITEGMWWDLGCTAVIFAIFIVLAAIGWICTSIKAWSERCMRELKARDKNREKK